MPSVKKPVLSGTRVQPTTTAKQRSNRLTAVVTRAFAQHDPLTFGANRASDARNAAREEVNAGRATEATTPPELAAGIQHARANALTVPCAVTVHWRTTTGAEVGTTTQTVSVATTVDAQANIAPADTVTVPMSRFTPPTHMQVADTDTTTITFTITRTEAGYTGAASVTVTDTTEDTTTNTTGDAHTLTVTPVMVVDTIRFPARQQWTLTTTHAPDLKTHLEKVITQHVHRALPQVHITQFNWSSDYTHADIDLAYLPQPLTPARAGSANLVPGGDVLGVFPAGFRMGDDVSAWSDDDCARVASVSDTLSTAIVAEANQLRQQAGLATLQAVAVDAGLAQDATVWGTVAAENKTTGTTPEQTAFLTRVGRVRCAELLLPRQKRRGDDSVSRLAAVFTRSAQRALDNGGRSALLSPHATGLTAVSVVYSVDNHSLSYETSVSVVLHADKA